ncbi:MAG: helix-turn-helix transcriptional regulator [Gaiellaceae bacterium]
MRERLLTARELAERLGVSSETVLRWTRDGEVPAIRLPRGSIRYRPDAIEAWLEGRATSAGAAVEESPDTPDHARRGGAYPAALVCELPDTLPPLEAATNEEEGHAR